MSKLFKVLLAVFVVMLLLSSCSQYKFVRAKPVKQKTTQAIVAEKQIKASKQKTNHLAKVKGIESGSLKNMAAQPQVKCELKSITTTNKIQASMAKEQIIDYVPEYKSYVDTPTTKTIMVEPKPYNSEWRDTAAKMGFAFTVAWILGLIMLIFVSASTVLFGGGNALLFAIIFAFAILLLWIAALIFSLIGLASENFKTFAIIGSVVNGVVLILYLISIFSQL